MNQHELQKRMIRYQGESEQIGFWLSRAKQSLPEDFEGYRRSLQDASGLAERLACGIRDVRVETCFCRDCCPRRRPVPAPFSPGRSQPL